MTEAPTERGGEPQLAEKIELCPRPNGMGLLVNGSVLVGASFLKMLGFEWTRELKSEGDDSEEPGSGAPPRGIPAIRVPKLNPSIFVDSAASRTEGEPPS